MTPQEELAALRELKALHAEKAGGVVSEPSWWDKASDMVPDVVKNIGTAAYKGVAGIAAGAADALAASHDVSDLGSVFSGKPPRVLDKTMPVSRALESTGYQPKTGGERLLNAGVRGATSGLISPAGMVSPVRAGIVGGLSGLSGEGVGQLPSVKGSPSEPYARAIASVLGGAAGGVLTSPMRNRSELAREALQGIHEDELNAAKDTMLRATRTGVPLNLDQALGKDTNVTNVMKVLVSRKEGQPLVDQLRKQPEQVQVLSGRLKNLLRGEVKEPAVVANESQSAATMAMTNARQARSNATRPFYQAAGDLDAGFVDGLHKQVLRASEAAPDTNKGALLAELADVIKGAGKRAEGTPSGLLDANGKLIPAVPLPISAEQLNDSFRSFATNLKNVNVNSKAGDKEAVGSVLGTLKDLRAQIGGVSPNFKLANDLHATLSRDVVDPLKKGVIGRVMGAAGELADKEAVNKLLPIIAKGRDPSSNTSEILQFAAATRNNPRVMQDAVKTYFSGIVADAEQQMHGQLSPNLAKVIEKKLLGDANKQQGWKDAVQAVAGGTEANPSRLYKGFMNGMKILSAAAKRPGGLGPDGAALDEIARESVTAGGLKMVGLAPGKPAARAVERVLAGDAYRTLADNLTTAEGVKRLQELAKLPAMSRKAQVLMSTILATASADHGIKPPEVQLSTPGDQRGEQQ